MIRREVVSRFSGLKVDTSLTVPMGSMALWKNGEVVYIAKVGDGRGRRVRHRHAAPGRLCAFEYDRDEAEMISTVGRRVGDFHHAIIKRRQATTGTESPIALARLLVGDFARGAQIFDRETATVEV